MAGRADLGREPDEHLLVVGEVATVVRRHVHAVADLLANRRITCTDLLERVSARLVEVGHATRLPAREPMPRGVERAGWHWIVRGPEIGPQDVARQRCKQPIQSRRNQPGLVQPSTERQQLACAACDVGINAIRQHAQTHHASFRVGDDDQLIASRAP